MRLNEMLNIRYPFIQGGMANIATGEFAAAVSNAGGLGLIGAGGMTAEQLRENIWKCKIGHIALIHTIMRQFLHHQFMDV